MYRAKIINIPSSPNDFQYILDYAIKNIKLQVSNVNLISMGNKCMIYFFLDDFKKQIIIYPIEKSISIMDKNKNTKIIPYKNYKSIHKIIVENI
jgi:hypothetical protein